MADGHVRLEELHAEERHEEHSADKHYRVQREHEPIQRYCGVSAGEGTSREYADQDRVQRHYLVGRVPGDSLEEVPVLHRWAQYTTTHAAVMRFSAGQAGADPPIEAPESPRARAARGQPTQLL